MAEKTMTQLEALEIAVEEVANDEARAVLAHMVDKKKNVSRKPRVNKEAEAFRAELTEALGKAEGPLSNAELAAAFGVKPQKVANNIRILEKAGVVARIRGEKPSDKDKFVLA